ncbi:MAG TPA: protein kinase [Polyangiaceae bacterium]|jgi:serine/threonine-protein kinase
MLVAGKYRLTRLLGRGGMGAVWEGTHTTLGTRVAVKFIDAEYAESPEAVSRFENEARAAAKLRSKHVVEVYDHGVTDDHRPFIVMEFLQGEPLDKRLDRVGRMPPKETAQIMLQVCRALTKAHAAGIVHRDLKPENVFLVWDDEDGADIAKVVDFGIAKFTDSSMGASSSTRTGSVLGTPYYMSPEQARGLRSVDYRSDLWSAAVIAYRCIVGALPFEGEAVGDLLVKLCTSPIPVPSQIAPDVPPGFDAWLVRALNRDPQGRFNNAVELAESLAAVCGLAVRGAYMSTDMPMYSSGSGTGPHPVASGSNPPRMSTPGPERASVVTLNMPSATGAPTTQTPNPSAGTSKSAIVASALAAVVVLSIGGAIVLKKVASKPDETPAVALPSAAPVAVVAKPVAPPPGNPIPTTAEAPAVASTPATPMHAAVAPLALPARHGVARPAAKPSEKPAAPKKEDIGF